MEDRRDKDDEVSRRIWKVVEASTGKVGVEKTKGERSKRRSQQKEKRKG